MDRFVSILLGALGFIVHGLRAAAWVMLTALRKPILFVLGFGTFAGWIGGCIVWPLIMYYGGRDNGMEFGWHMYAYFIGLGAAMGTLCPLMMVGYDSLLFRLQPKDREVIYIS